MKELFNNKGLTLVEIIMTLAILGVVICPLMNLLVLSQKINSEGEKEYRIIQTAQYFMEEIRAMDEIDTGVFIYNGEEMCYERIVLDVLDDYSAEIKITPGSYGLHYIEVNILNDGEVINSLTGSIVID
jgi:prepilin-type N-terminal cleavage/methylation domain-containing protein